MLFQASVFSLHCLHFYKAKLLKCLSNFPKEGSREFFQPFSKMPQKYKKLLQASEDACRSR